MILLSAGRDSQKNKEGGILIERKFKELHDNRRTATGRLYFGKSTGKDAKEAGGQS